MSFEALTPMQDVPSNLLHRLKSHGQEHVHYGWATLSDADRASLVEQLAGIDFAELEALYAKRNASHTVLPARDKLAPLPVEDRSSASEQSNTLGEDAIRRH